MHQPTLRVLQVLQRIAQDSSGLRLADLSRDLEIPKSTLLPILQTLLQSKHLSQDDMGRYLPGTSLFALGTAFSGSFPVLRYVQEQLQQLVKNLDETCYFGVLEAGQVLYLEKAESSQPLRMLTATGHRLPAYATGIGKALLCELDGDLLRQMYPNGLMPLTGHTITDFGLLQQQLAEAKAENYAWECEESTPHVRCFAVPVRKHGTIVAAISVTIPLFRYKEEDRPRIIHTIQTAAAQMSTVFEQTNAHFGDLF